MLDPENVRFLLLAMRQHKLMNVAQTRKWLHNESGYTIDEANDAILKAIFDGFLISNGESLKKMKVTKSVKDTVLLKMRDFDSTPDLLGGDDPYCYECHKPGSLDACSNCNRSFHSACQRKDLFVSKLSKHIKLKNHVQLESFSNEECDFNSSNIRDHEDMNTSVAQNECPMLDDVTLNTTPNKLKEEQFLETEYKDEDVICVGQIREPNRNRSRNHDENIKNELQQLDDLNENTEEDELLCTHCRIIKKSPSLDPTGISKKEISYLLYFVYSRISDWISPDTYSTITKNKSIAPPNQEDINFVKKFCFKYPKTLKDIEAKIKNNNYNSLSEFYVDFLDIQHCVGIIYGTLTEEYLATEYQLKDCNYELSEIRQCRDCYRRSNDKNFIQDWFCKPCVPRHELVFAKKTPWPFWPAKVIKFKDNKYDVRFFSDRHERAIIDAKFIKPLDLYNPTKVSTALKKALLELEKYQMYDKQPVGTFSFENECIENRTITPLNIQKKKDDIFRSLRTRKYKPALDDNVPKLNSSHVINETVELPGKPMTTRQTRSGKIVVKASSIIGNRKTSSQNSNNVEPKKFYDIVEKLGKKIDRISSKTEIKTIVMDTMQKELKSLNDKIEQLQNQIIETKKNPWCKWCLQLASLYCCNNTSYCTLECQRKDWHSEHKYKCTHRNENALFHNF